VTVLFGVVLIALGGGFYFSIIEADTGGHPPTALIPAAMGLVFVILGALSFNEKRRKHTMHAAAALGLIGLLVTGYMGLPKLVTLLSGGEVPRPLAVYEQSITAGLCFVFVALCVNSFIQARILRRKQM
jgi:hypothetical protein